MLHVSFNIIKMKYDSGFQQKGTCYGPDILEKYLNYERIHEIKARDTRNNLGEGFMQSLAVHDSEKFPLLIGGESTNSISSIFASNMYCKKKDKSLGVLWCSPLKYDVLLFNNFIHTTIPVLCGYEFPELWFGNFLNSSQFMYYSKHNSENENSYSVVDYYNVILCLEKYDKVHVVFDTTLLYNDKNENKYSYEEINDMFLSLKTMRKHLAMDIIGFNPIFGDEASKISNIVKLLVS